MPARITCQRIRPSYGEETEAHNLSAADGGGAGGVSRGGKDEEKKRRMRRSKE